MDVQHRRQGIGPAAGPLCRRIVIGLELLLQLGPGDQDLHAFPKHCLMYPNCSEYPWGVLISLLYDRGTPIRAQDL